jgi:hypothetical protein
LCQRRREPSADVNRGGRLPPRAPRSAVGQSADARAEPGRPTHRKGGCDGCRLRGRCSEGISPWSRRRTTKGLDRPSSSAASAGESATSDGGYRKAGEVGRPVSITVVPDQPRHRAGPASTSVLLSAELTDAPVGPKSDTSVRVWRQGSRSVVRSRKPPERLCHNGLPVLRRTLQATLLLAGSVALTSVYSSVHSTAGIGLIVLPPLLWLIALFSVAGEWALRRPWSL